uniref:Uncharacterized protein n=1 Tax=Sphaerodactylus townsendi TaxID=933632 RepID=A0ACB8EPN4_9SAUR
MLWCLGPEICIASGHGAERHPDLQPPQVAWVAPLPTLHLVGQGRAFLQVDPTPRGGSVELEEGKDQADAQSPCPKNETTVCGDEELDEETLLQELHLNLVHTALGPLMPEPQWTKLQRYPGPLQAHLMMIK